MLFRSAYFTVEGRKVKVWKAEKTDEYSEKETGTVVFIDKEIGLVVDGRIIRLKELQPEGKQKMNAREFRNGAGRNWEGKKAE